jgi:hypothetical protein
MMTQLPTHTHSLLLFIDEPHTFACNPSAHTLRLSLFTVAATLTTSFNPNAHITHLDYVRSPLTTLYLHSIPAAITAAW